MTNKLIFSLVVSFGLFIQSFNLLGQSTSALKKNDKPLGIPQSNDWLYVHKEKGQTLQQYMQASPVTPTPTRNKIYLQPIGKFTALGKQLIKHTADYLQIFFDRNVIVLNEVDAHMVPDSARRDKHTPEEQLLTTPILDYLEKSIPSDAFVFMAITSYDLYPSLDFNFVFGVARTKQRVGVSSFFRFADQGLSASNYALCLSRIIKTSSHEMTHMLTVQHCIHAVCLMNGSNSLTEADQKPNRLCSVCVQKLHWNLRFDVRARLKKMVEYFEKHKLLNDLGLAKADLSLLKE